MQEYDGKADEMRRKHQGFVDVLLISHPTQSYTEYFAQPFVVPNLPLTPYKLFFKGVPPKVWSGYLWMKIV